MQLGLWCANLRHINAMFWTIAFFFARIRTLSITCCAFKQSQWCHVEPYFNSWCHSWYCDITSWNLIYTQQHLWVIQRGSTGLSFGGGRESWALPSSPLYVAGLTHSSPGPMLPQSSTASLRTLVYDSAAVQGSGGDSRQEIQLYTHVQTHNRHITSVCRLSGVHPASNLITARSVTGVGVGSLSQSALKQEQEICFLTL